MSGAQSQLRNRKQDPLESEKIKETTQDPPISEIEPACSDEDVSARSSKQAGAGEDQPAVDPLKDVKAGIHRAPCSMEFWVVFGTVLLCFGGVKYLEMLPDTPQSRVFTKVELKKYDGSEEGPVYLAILGQVFDVTKGKRYYGEGGGYQVFCGKDASRAFIVGDFQNNLSDDVRDFSAEQFMGLVEWRDFYRDSKDYDFVGLLEGAFYDSKGNPTIALKQAEAGAIDGVKVKGLRELEREKHPNCNSKWSQAKGGEVYCENGYPRRITDHIPGAKPSTRCACFAEQDYSDTRKLMEDCAPDQQRCKTYRKGEKKPSKEQATTES